MTKSALAFCLLAAAFLPACGDDDDSDGETADTIEIAGVWESNFMSTEEIHDGSWSVESSFGPSSSEIVEFDNDDNSAVLLGEDGTYGRNVWTEISDGTFYYCMVAYGKDSAAAAVAESEPFDDSDPLNSGCGTASFGWTQLSKQ